MCAKSTSWTRSTSWTESKKVGDGKFQQARFLHSLDPVSPKARAGVDHNHMFDPKTQWRGGELAERQVGGYDMKARLDAIAREGIDRQILFPTTMNIPAMNYGGLGLALCQCINNAEGPGAIGRGAAEQDGYRSGNR